MVVADPASITTSGRGSHLLAATTSLAALVTARLAEHALFDRAHRLAAPAMEV